MTTRYRLLCASALLSVAVLTAAQSPPQASAPVTWTRDVAPVVFHSCAECHRPGGPGPFSLLTYADVKRHARQIAQVTGSRFMPPWLPDADSGPFVLARRLPDAQIAMLNQWAAQGAPEGDAPDLPPVPRFNDGWRLGPPDLVAKMLRPYTLPPETTGAFRCFVLPLTLPQGRQLRAIELRPGSAVVRHATLYADAAGAARRLEAESGAVGYAARGAGLGPDARPLAEWSVGSGPYTLPDGVAAGLPAKADLVLLLRLEPDGQSEQVQCRVGLYFVPASATVSPVPLTLGARDLILDPGQTATVADTFTLPVAARLLRVTPHGHPVCRTLRVLADTHSLLHIADWNADWPDAYRFADPPVLPAGTRLTVNWTADNTAANPRNPSAPPMTVLPGLLYLDDMATVRFELVPVNPADAARLALAAQAPRPAPTVQTTAPNRHG